MQNVLHGQNHRLEHCSWEPWCAEMITRVVVQVRAVGH